MRLTNHYIGPHSPPGTVRPLPVIPRRSEPKVMTAAEAKPRLTLRNAIAYVRAVAGLLVRGPVGLGTRLARSRACLACPHRRVRPGSSEPIGWCSACGCGGSARAALSRKIMMPTATCPKGRWPEAATTAPETSVPRPPGYPDRRPRPHREAAD